MLFLLVLEAWQIVLLTKNMLFLLVLKGWQAVVLTKKPVDSLDIEG